MTPMIVEHPLLQHKISLLRNKQTDGGPILLQKAVDILPGDTPEVLQTRVMEQAEWKLLPKAVAMICNGEVE